MSASQPPTSEAPAHELSCAQREALRAEVERLFVAQRERLDAYIAAARWGLVIIAAALGSLGYLTGDKLLERVEAAYLSRLEGHFRLGDPDGQAAKRINRYIDEAFVYAATARRIRADRFGAADLSGVEAQRTLRALQSSIERIEAVDKGLFADALELLDTAVPCGDSRESISRGIVALVRNDQASTEERASLLERAVGDAGVAHALELIRGRYGRPRMRLAAVRALEAAGPRRVPLQDALPLILELAATPGDLTLRETAERTLARLSPNHPRVKELLSDRSPPLDAFAVATALFAPLDDVLVEQGARATAVRVILRGLQAGVYVINAGERWKAVDGSREREINPAVLTGQAFESLSPRDASSAPAFARLYGGLFGPVDPAARRNVDLSSDPHSGKRELPVYPVHADAFVDLADGTRLTHPHLSGEWRFRVAWPGALFRERGHSREQLDRTFQVWLLDSGDGFQQLRTPAA